MVEKMEPTGAHGAGPPFCQDIRPDPLLSINKPAEELWHTPSAQRGGDGGPLTLTDYR